MDEAAVVRSWREAADDLGIEVIAPASVTLGSKSFDALALLPEFGALNGMVLFGRFSATEGLVDPDGRLFREYHYGFSYLAASYETYRRDLFIDTLNDWGWTSNARPAPDWYTGQPWSE